MKIIKLWRTFKEGAENYRRNGWLTFATVSVLTLSLFVLSLTAIIAFTGYLSIQGLQEKFSVSVSFKPEVSETRIMSVKEDLGKYKEISSIQYISREQALDDFLRDGNPILSEAVKEIGENPLLASLVIKAENPEHYALIAAQLQNSEYQDEIDRVNYEQNKKSIDRLNTLTDQTRDIGIMFGFIFTTIAVLITFNSIRLTIYSHRQEFEVMRLVGASNLYIKMPFFFEGVFYGLTAAFTTIILLTVTTYALSRDVGPYLSTILDGKTLIGVYASLLWVSIPSIVIVSVLLGVISSAIAIRRYLRI